MHLLLIRHGETDWNAEGRMQGRVNVPLNAKGVEQAERLAERLADEERIDILYTSPLLRARATAEIVGAKFGLVPIADMRLVERSVGQLEGLTLADFKERYPDLHRQWQESKEHIRLPNAETREDCVERIESFLAMARPRHEGARVALVTHGGTLGLLFAMLLELDIRKRLPFRFDNASFSKVELTKASPRIELLNDTCHLNISRRAQPSENAQAEVNVLSSMESR